MFLLIGFIITILTLLLLGLLVLVRNKKSSINKSFGLFTLIAVCWITANFIGANYKGAFFSHYFLYMDYLLGPWVAYSLWLFAERLLFQARHKSVKVSISDTALAVTVTASLLAAPGVVSGIAKKSATGIFNENLYLVYSILVLVIVLASVTTMITAMKSAKGQFRVQLTTMLWGLGVAGFLIVTANLVVPQITSSEAINLLSGNLSYLGIVFFAVLTAYAIIKHQLFDIHFFAVRASAYVTVLFATALLLVAPIILAFGYFLDFHPTVLQFTLVVVSAVVALYTILYLKGLFDKYTSRFFFRHYYNPQEVLNDIGDTLAQTADIELLKAKCSRILKATIKPSYLKYLLLTSNDVNESSLAQEISKMGNYNLLVTDDLEENSRVSQLLRKEDIAIVLKLRTTHENLGYIVLGYKQSGQAYSIRDTQMLSVATSEIAISLQNALRFEETKSFNETLKREIAVATYQLRETNAKLRKVDRQKDEFIGMASHQLRTPLTSIKGYVSLVLDNDAGRITGTQRKLLEQAFTSSQRMVYLIADLLNVSRLKSGKFVIERVPTNLSKMISDEMAQLKTAASTHNVTLTFTPPSEFPTLMLDETKTRQVIMNFLDNAIYYTPTGGHIAAVLRDLPKSIEFEVTDDGIGVPKAERHHLFTKFYRAKNAQRARPDGTGLGLFMAQKVIIAQGGAIIFDSKEGVGSKFGFSFPKEMPADAAELAIIRE